jgi:hypothetical protein
MKTSIYHRLQSSPAEFTDDDLRRLMERDYSNARGVNKQIPVAAFLELERRQNTRSTPAPLRPTSPMKG